MFILLFLILYGSASAKEDPPKQVDVQTEVFELSKEVEFLLFLEYALEEPLQTLLQIETVYGFRIQDDYLEACAEEFGRVKNRLMEHGLFFKYCMEELAPEKLMNFINLKNMTMTDNTLEEIKSLALICGGDFRMTLRTHLRLFYYTFNQSFRCLTRLLQETFEVMVLKNYFGAMLNDIKVHSKEINLILENSNRTSSQKVLEGEEIKQDPLDFVKTQLDSLQKEVNSNMDDWTKKIRDFEASVGDVPDIDERSWKQVFVLSRYLHIKIFHPFFQTSDRSGNSKDDKDSGNYHGHFHSIMKVHKRVKKIHRNVTVTLRKSNAVLIVKEIKISQELFNSVTSTIGAHCANSELHLAGTCTVANNEICLEPKATLNSGFYISNFLPVKECQCGFNLKCVNSRKKNKELERRIWECRLYPNPDSLCRGGLGYPCKSFPLAPKYYDESCMSRKCNRDKDECEHSEDTKKKRGPFPPGWKESLHTLM